MIQLCGFIEGCGHALKGRHKNQDVISHGLPYRYQYDGRHCGGGARQPGGCGQAQLS